MLPGVVSTDARIPANPAASGDHLWVLIYLYYTTVLTLVKGAIG